MASFSGHTAMVESLKKCNLSIMNDHNYDIQAHYLYNYNALLKHRYVAINITIYTHENFALKDDFYKFLTLLPKLPILWLVRDPISRLKSSLNNSWEKTSTLLHLDSSTSLSCLDNRIHYWIDEEKSMSERIRISIHRNTFGYAALYEIMQTLGFKDMVFLDMRDIEPDRAFATFCALAKEFGFKAPMKKDLFYQKTFIQACNGFLPLFYEACGITFYLSVYKKAQKDSNYIVLESPFLGHILYVFAPLQYKSTIEENRANIESSLQHFIKKIEQKIESLNTKHKTSEKEILNLLRENKSLRQELQDILTKEAACVAAHRKDIIASWWYYRNFQALCNEAL